MHPGERLAVIDLGSNSFRLVVFATGASRPGGAVWWRRTDEIYQPVRIAEGAEAAGRLVEGPVERALAALEVFAHFCDATGLDPGEIDAVATSAIRDASNGEEFLEHARERTGLPIRLLSGEQEARYAYLAAVNSTTLANGFAMDLGGGSLQLMRVQSRAEREWRSWPLGTVRMTERLLPGDGPASGDQLDALRAYVRAALRDAAWLDAGAPDAREREDRADAAERSATTGRNGGGPAVNVPIGEGPHDGKRVVGLGGTLRNLASALQRAGGLPDWGVQGASIERRALSKLIARLAALPVRERAQEPGIKPARADVILAGALTVEAVLDRVGAQRIEVTEAGLREGIFFARHLAGREPPLLPDVRRTSVLNLAARYGANGPHHDHVATLALSMFDQLAWLGVHRGDPHERELLWAASMLHDIGMSVDYDDHHKHSRYLILSGGMPGFSPREVALIAQTVRYHRKAMPTPGPLGALFGKGDKRRLERCVALLRLAEDLERARDQLVREVTLSGRDGRVELRLQGDGASALPRWAATRERELFERAFGRELVVA
jgi:exopolyphosphatase/guanosine-5'-triphosphate,3'-diphosphate pyrophosphatase